MLLELTVATFTNDDSSAPRMSPPVQRWNDDPRIEIAQSANALVVPGGAARLAWAAAPPKLSAGELTAKVLAGATPESIQLEVEILSRPSPATTTIVVRAQQTIILALPGAPGLVVIATPYLAAGPNQLAQLRACKPGPWIEATAQNAKTPTG